MAQKHKYEPARSGKEIMPACSCRWTFPGGPFTTEAGAKKAWETHVKKAS